MGVEYEGCSNCGAGVYEEYIAETECCNKNVCSECVIPGDVEYDGAYIHPFINKEMIDTDYLISKKHCPHCAEKSLEETLNHFNEVFEESNKVGKSILDRLKDKTLPLDERWKIYEKFANKYPDFNIENYVCNFYSIDDDKFTMYDDFYIDRYQTAYILNMIETIEENINEEKEKININEFKEEVLGMGITGFVHDW